MKKLLFATALCSCLGAGAQTVTLTPEAGISAVQRHGWGQSWRPSVKTGVAADFKINHYFSIESGLFYTFRGYSTNVGKFSNDNAEWFERVSETRHFLQIPVMAKFSWSIAQDTRMFFGIGPYIGFCLKNHFDSTPLYISSSYPNGYYDGVAAPSGTDMFGNSNQDLYQKARTFDWGINAMVGIETKRWITKLQYDMSLGKESGGDPIGVNYHTLTLSVGYKFHL